jgi:hypothetical protein
MRELKGKEAVVKKTKSLYGFLGRVNGWWEELRHGLVCCWSEWGEGLLIRGLSNVQLEQRDGPYELK